MTNPESPRSPFVAFLLLAVLVVSVGIRLGAATLPNGEVLYPGQSINSDDGSYFLLYQSDGNLVLYQQDQTPVWWTGTDGTSPGQVAMQTDGNLVVYDVNGVPLWASGTSGNPGAYLNVGDGVVSVDGPDGSTLWQAGTAGAMCGGFMGGDTLASGQVLCTNVAVTSPSGTFSLLYQDDGNLVLYQADGTPVWFTGTNGTSAGHVSMELGGNLVVYDSNGDPLWSSGTDGNPGASLVVQDDGSLVIVDANGNQLWSSD